MRDIEGIDELIAAIAPHRREIEDEFERHNRRFLELAAADHDTIGRVLRAHLVIENFLNHFLEQTYKIEEIEAVRLSFFQKAMLLPAKLSGAALVRPGILQLNAARNRLGHQIPYAIQMHEISGISEVLRISRSKLQFDNPVAAIEAFAPIACAFLAVPPPHLQEVFLKAFNAIHSYTPEQIV